MFKEMGTDKRHNVGQYLQNLKIIDLGSSFKELL